MKSDNLDDFFHLDDFAVEVSFTNPQGNKETALVQFDAHPIDSHLGQINYEINQPQITGSYQELKDLTPRDLVSIEGKTYRVEHYPDHDGTGLAIVKLSEEG